MQFCVKKLGSGFESDRLWFKTKAYVKAIISHLCQLVVIKTNYIQKNKYDAAGLKHNSPKNYLWHYAYLYMINIINIYNESFVSQSFTHIYWLLNI